MSDGVDPADIDSTRRSYCGPARFSGFNGGVQDYVEFLFTPGRVTITNEMGLIRRIRLTTQPMRGAPDETYTGVSIGHWDGRTLVVETRGLRPDIRWGEPLYKRPIRIGRNVRILERFTLKSPDLMQVTTQWTAPDLLAQPYESTLYYGRDPRHEFREITNCDETDRAFDDATGRERFILTPPPDLTAATLTATAAAARRPRPAAPHPSSVHLFRARTRGRMKRTPSSSLGLNHRSCSNTRAASPKRPNLHKHNPNPCKHRKKGRLSINPHGSKPSKRSPSARRPICTPSE